MATNIQLCYYKTPPLFAVPGGGKSWTFMNWNIKLGIL